MPSATDTYEIYGISNYNPDVHEVNSELRYQVLDNYTLIGSGSGSVDSTFNVAGYTGFALFIDDYMAINKILLGSAALTTDVNNCLITGNLDFMPVEGFTYPELFGASDGLYLKDNEFDGGGVLIFSTKSASNLSVAIDSFSVAIDSFNVVGTTGMDHLVGDVRDNALTGFAGNDTLDGGAGIDRANYTGNRANFTLTQSGASFIITDSTGAQGTDMLTNMERLNFTDMSIALDVAGGNAGTTAKILGAVFGTASVSNKEYVGIGLNLLDNGMNYSDLMLLALNARLGASFSSSDEVNLLYQNLVGVLPSIADLNYFVGTISSGQFTQSSLAVMAADLDLNATNINLTGLAQTGIEFTG
ncbi:MAG: hypothetical protein Q8O19_02315 [Rectinemataceae bacterium]|nr:hypothetical protein [Rectinemataceae bacterium]